VELLLNGRSLGRKQNDRTNPKVRNQIRWDKFDYEPGTIEAVARNAGKIVARHRVETAGEAVKLIMVPDVQTWRADGIDIQHITVQAVDKKGRIVPQANHDVQFTVEGDARLVAVSSGDHYSDELTQTDHRRLYEGRALAILRAGRQPSTITLTAIAPGLKSAKLKLITQ
jgi:beta-galactosidase